MSLIVTPTYPNDSESADAADYNGIIQSIIAVVNGQIDGDNIAANAITTVKVANEAINPAKRSGGYKTGTIPGSTFSTTGNKAITGVGFRPKMVRFTVVPTTSNTTLIGGNGSMDEDGDQFSFLLWATSTTAARRGFSASCIGFMDTSTTTGMAASYVSMNTDGFTINVSTANGTFDIGYEAFA